MLTQKEPVVHLDAVLSLQIGGVPYQYSGKLNIIANESRI